MTLISGTGSLRAAALTDLLETENAAGVSGRSSNSQLLNAGIALAKPLVADFTWVNQGTATAADTDRGVVLTHVDHASTQLRALAKAKPAAPFTLTTKLRYNGVRRDYAGFGIGWRKSSTAENRSLWVLVGVTDPPLAQRLTMANDTGAFSSRTTILNYVDHVSWLRISDDGTNRNYYFSNDGDNWVLLATELVASFISDANQIMVFTHLINSGGATDAKLLIEHWLIT